MKKSIIVTMLCLAATQTFGQQTNKALQQINWMLGAWQLKTPGMTITESWKQDNEASFSGNSYAVTAKGDTIFTERLRLIAEKGILYYLPTVSNQNAGKEVRFKQKTLTQTEVVFENLKHDFPQRIVYRKTSANTILAYIEGTKNGKYKKEEFPYTRK